MNGNGCAGSIASGVSTGKMRGEEMLLQPVALRLGEVLGSTMTMPFGAKLRRNSRQRAC